MSHYGNLQKIKNGKRTYGITPHIPGGFILPETLIKIGEVAKKYNGVLKITSGQRILITNLKEEDLKDIIISKRKMDLFYKNLVVTEVNKVKNYYKAEEYHQQYLKKNPNGYCHIPDYIQSKNKKLLQASCLYLNIIK